MYNDNFRQSINTYRRVHTVGRGTAGTAFPYASFILVHVLARLLIVYSCSGYALRNKSEKKKRIGINFVILHCLNQETVENAQ